MANKGKGLMSEESWNEIHAEEEPGIDMAFGGNNLFVFNQSQKSTKLL